MTPDTDYVEDTFLPGAVSAWNATAGVLSVTLIIMVILLCLKKKSKEKDKPRKFAELGEKSNGTRENAELDQVLLHEAHLEDYNQDTPHYVTKVHVNNETEENNAHPLPPTHPHPAHNDLPPHYANNNRSSGFYEYSADVAPSRENSQKNRHSNASTKDKKSKKESDKDKKEREKYEKAFREKVKKRKGLEKKTSPVSELHLSRSLSAMNNETLIQDLVIPTILPRLIKVEELDDYLREAQKSGEIPKQYKAIPRSMGYPIEESEKPEHREKNRYKNIVPYDYNRVKLNVLPNDPNSHYINASYIKDLSKDKQSKSDTDERRFIAAQGPIESTIVDFWRMIWEQHISIIVMVTNPWERGMKCLVYWPEGSDTAIRSSDTAIRGSDTAIKIGDIEIQLEKENITVYPDYTLRRMTARKENETREVTQFQFRTWPDHGVPRHAMALLNFRDKVKAAIKDVKTPVLVHCSAGVGRTGTFLAIDHLIEEAKSKGAVDVIDCVRQLRCYRSDLVQTVEQYGFIYQALLEYLVLGQTTIACNEFDKEHQSLQQPAKDGITPMHKQFIMLDQFMAEKTTNESLVGQEKVNLLKNRSSDIVPTDDIRRVKLLTEMKDRNNYINAVFADGHRRLGSFIATHAPLSNTTLDLWRAVTEYKSSVIIMLDPVQKLKDGEIYFPLEKGTVRSIPPYEIECCNLQFSLGVQVRNLLVQYKKDKREVLHMAVTFDLESLSAGEMMEKTVLLYEKMMRWQQRHKSDAQTLQARPVVVHCLDGVTWTGLFVVLCHLFDQINNDQEVDIFNAVRQARLARPQFISSLEQYSLLHKVVGLYIDSFRTYSNFK